MANKYVMRNKNSVFKRQMNPMYNDAPETNTNGNPSNVYLEFDKNEQDFVYSYATETSLEDISTGRSGTVTSYTQGRVGTSDRSRDTNDQYLRNRDEYPAIVSVPALGQSTSSTNTTYDRIREPDVNAEVNLRVRRRSRRSVHQTNKSSSVGRVIAILTLFVAIVIAGVLVYIFVIDKEQQKGAECNSIPKVLNGQIAESRSKGESVTVTVVCSSGYKIDGNDTMTCDDGEWTASPKCIPVQCGDLPPVANGTINGTSFDFNATAEVVCDPGFLQEGSSSITCQADGNWSSGSQCVQHPCGIYTPTEELSLVTEMNSVFMTLCFECKPGLTFVNGSDHCVACNESIWKGQPECELQGTVNFDAHELSYTVNDTVSLTCILRDAPDWHSVILARTDLQGSNMEPLYNVLNTSGTIEVIQLRNTSTFTVSYAPVSNGVTLVLKIHQVQCKDSGVYICENIFGSVDSPDKVKAGNTSVYIKGKTDIPHWVQFMDDIIPGSIAIFKCSAEIGDPKGYIDVESNLDGTDGNYSIILTTQRTQDSNDVGFINYFTDEKTSCGYNRTVVFSIRNVTSRYHRKGLRCVSRPSDYPEDDHSAVSETRFIEVIPDDLCKLSDTILPHPYRCDRFVICGNGKVAGIPAGCGDNNCFNNGDNTCYPCEQIGGCSLTDIYIDGYHGWVSEGDVVTLICDIKYFEGLTDIEIRKGDDNTIVSKLSDGDIESDTGITYVSEQSYITESHGQLTLRIGSVQCSHEGIYHCFPVGSGKYSDDETSLALKDADGNEIC